MAKRSRAMTPAEARLVEARWVIEHSLPRRMVGEDGEQSEERARRDAWLKGEEK